MASKVAPATHRAAIEVSSTEKRAGARSKHLPEFLYLSLSNRAPCLVEARAQARRFDKQNAGPLRKRIVRLIGRPEIAFLEAISLLHWSESSH